MTAMVMVRRAITGEMNPKSANFLFMRLRGIGRIKEFSIKKIT
jgi:hypothetical protein